MESSKPAKKKQMEPGPERPTDESQMGVSYIDFDELQPLSEDYQSNLDEFVRIII